MKLHLLQQLNQMQLPNNLVQMINELHKDSSEMILPEFKKYNDNMVGFDIPTKLGNYIEYTLYDTSEFYYDNYIMQNRYGYEIFINSGNGIISCGTLNVDHVPSTEEIFQLSTLYNTQTISTLLQLLELKNKISKLNCSAYISIREFRSGDDFVNTVHRKLYSLYQKISLDIE